MRPSGRSIGPPKGWLAVGHLRRPHGLKGEIFVQLTTDRSERVMAAQSCSLEVKN